MNHQHRMHMCSRKIAEVAAFIIKYGVVLRCQVEVKAVHLYSPLMPLQLTAISGGTVIYPVAMSLSGEIYASHAKLGLPGPSEFEMGLA